jgi:hypothetical protein
MVAIFCEVLNKCDITCRCSRQLVPEVSAALAHVSFKPMSSGSISAQPAPRRRINVRKLQNDMRRAATYEAARPDAAERRFRMREERLGLGLLPHLAQHGIKSMRRITSTIFWRSQTIPHAAATVTAAALRAFVVAPVAQAAIKVRAAATETVTRASSLQLPILSDGQLRLVHSAQIRL